MWPTSNNPSLITASTPSIYHPVRFVINSVVIIDTIYTIFLELLGNVNIYRYILTIDRYKLTDRRE